MRITSGAARGINLKTLDIPQLRPATDALRQALFNSLGTFVSGANFLDLFAGCGAYGLEAVSRGATSGVFVEKHPKLKAIIEQNIAAVCKSAQVSAASFSARTADALTYLPVPGSADIVFCDPPYDMIEANLPALRAVALQALKVGGVFIMEHPAQIEIPADAFRLIKQLGGKGARAPNVDVLQKV